MTVVVQGCKIISHVPCEGNEMGGGSLAMHRLLVCCSHVSCCCLRPGLLLSLMSAVMSSWLTWRYVEVQQLMLGNHNRYYVCKTYVVTF